MPSVLRMVFRIIKKPERAYPMNPAQACADTVQWTYDILIKENHKNDIVFFCDSDLFLIDEFDIVEYMNDAIIAGLPQYRGSVIYMWNGIMFFNMPIIIESKYSKNIVEMYIEWHERMWYYEGDAGIIAKQREKMFIFPI